MTIDDIESMEKRMIRSGAIRRGHVITVSGFSEGVNVRLLMLGLLARNDRGCFIAATTRKELATMKKMLSL